MKNEEYTHDAAEMETTQTTANGVVPLAGNDVANPYTDLAVTEQLPQSLQHAPLRRRQTELPKPFNGLTAAQITSVSDRVMYYIRELCHQRGASVDFDYWRNITKNVLKGVDDRKPLVCPARAGSGKSTWISAFLLADCELRLNNDPLADVFSVLLVLQKIESLNGIRDTIAAFFPNAPETLVVPLQGWTTAGQQAGFCKNAQVTSFDQCPRDNCTYAASCGVLRFGQLAGQAFVLGVSQARFDLLRKGNALDGLLYQDENAHPRILIFDEKFEFAPIYRLTQTTLDTASSQLERLITQRDLKDRRVFEKQRWTTAILRRPFSLLRERTCIELDETIKAMADIPYGLCSLMDADNAEKERFGRFRDYLNGSGRAFRTPALSEAVEVIDRLYRGECLFTKLGAFTILGADEPQISFGDSLTLVFDATAQVDGDYQYLDAEMLPQSKPRHMEKLCLHVYTTADMNVSRLAMRKSWKLPGFCALTEDILRRYEGKMFLTTYKDLAAEIPKLLDPQALSRLLLDGETCPYFGGTNGSNEFNTASLVMLLGYPRLSPQTYLERAFVYWGRSGIREQVQGQMAQWSPLNVQQRPDLHAQLPLTMAYEVCHLAARLEQEIYRCQLRNAVCDKAVHVFLFAPSLELLHRLAERFQGAKLWYEDRIPACIARAKATAKQYDGNPTVYARFVAWLSGWDRVPTPLSSILHDTDIGAESWKKLRKSERFAPLLAQYGAEMTGRGRNVKIEEKSQKCA